jgi:carboxymethylenebutenolidase
MASASRPTRNPMFAPSSTASCRQPVDRRGFIVTALGAGFALPCSPTAAQSPIKTEHRGAHRRRGQGQGRGRRDGRLSRHAGRARPALPVVLVVSEIFGVHEYIADVCRRLAKEGYLAIAPELFARYGDPRKYANVADLLCRRWLPRCPMPA